MKLILAFTIAVCVTAADKNVAFTDAACTVAKLGTGIDASAIGEPVAAVALKPPVWVNAKANEPAHCSIDGSMAPIEKGTTAKPINFRILLPGSWSQRAAQRRALQPATRRQRQSVGCNPCAGPS